MTSQHTADYPTLQEVLRLPVFVGCTVCGGAAGLGRRVSGVNLTDTPDYARWLAQGELLITTGFAIADDPQAVDALLPTAAEKGLSGVGIKPGRYLPSPLPAALAEKADRLGLPLLQLPDEDLQQRAIRHMAAEELNVRQGEEYLRQLLHRQQHPPYRGLLRDYRILFTTVDRAVEEIRRFGVAVTTRRREEDDCISYTIRIPKSAKKEREPKDQLSLYA